jgi:hypothetical protein
MWPMSESIKLIKLVKLKIELPYIFLYLLSDADLEMVVK